MRQVSPNATLLTPVKCKSLWTQFKADITCIVNQATSDQVPYHELLCIFIVTLFVRPFSELWTETNIYRNAPALFQNCITCFIFQLKFLILNLTSTLTCHASYFPQEARKQSKKVIQQMFRLVLLVLLVMIMTYGIAAKPEALSFLGPQMVAAIMALVAKMKARWR